MASQATPATGKFLRGETLSSEDQAELRDLLFDYDNIFIPPFFDIAGYGDSMTSAAQGYGNYIITQMVTGSFSNGGVGGETSTQVKDRYLAASNTEKQKTLVIWVGRNNNTATAIILADVAAMVGAHTAARALVGKLPEYIVLSVCNGNYATEYNTGVNYHYFTDIRDALSALYGARFLDIRQLLVDAYNPDLPQDVIDHGRGITPTSLRTDDIHLNAAGNTKVAFWIWQKLNTVYPQLMVPVLWHQISGLVRKLTDNINIWNTGGINFRTALGIGSARLSASGDGQLVQVSGGGVMPASNTNQKLGNDLGNDSNHWGGVYSKNYYQRSPNGTLYKLNVTDGGASVWTAVP